MPLAASDARSYSLNITIDAMATDLLTSPSDSYTIEMTIFLDSHRHIDYIVKCHIVVSAQPTAYDMSVGWNWCRKCET
jgi:hypothetical protein